MGIYNNGYRLGNNPFKMRCGALTTIYNPATKFVAQSAAGWKRGIQYNTGTLTAIPQGSNTPGTWMLPQKAGGMSSHNEAQGDSDATLSMASGINIAGLAEGSTPTVEATLQLVVSMLATALGEATVSGNLNAALGMSGTSAGVASQTAVINALAWAIGQANGEATATLVSYATGELAGSITPFTELSPENLAAAVWGQIIEAGYSADEILRIVAAHAAGAATGLEGSDMQFTGLDGSTVRIDGNYSGGTRTIDSLNGA